MTTKRLQYFLALSWSIRSLKMLFSSFLKIMVYNFRLTKRYQQHTVWMSIRIKLKIFKISIKDLLGFFAWPMLKNLELAEFEDFINLRKIAKWRWWTKLMPFWTKATRWRTCPVRIVEVWHSRCLALTRSHARNAINNMSQRLKKKMIKLKTNTKNFFKPTNKGLLNRKRVRKFLRKLEQNSFKDGRCYKNLAQVISTWT